MGKGGGALSAWIKEFVSLVMVQTVQAFIFAIILSIILFGMTQKDGSISANDNNSALGLMSVFALLSIFKVEDMVKKIFGISNTKADHRNAIQSIAKTAIAARIGGRVLNNAGKFIGGAKATFGAGQQRRKLKKRLDEDMQDNGFKRENGKIVSISSNKNAGSGRRSGTIPAGSTTGVGGSAADFDTEGIAGAGSASAAAQANEMSGAAQRRIRNALRTYEDRAAEINKARNQGIKDMLSSVAESGGALVGGTAGGILGGADGDFEGMVRGMMAGGGVGDVVGKNTVEALDRATKLVSKSFKPHEAGVSNRELKRAISNYKAAVENTAKNYSAGADIDDHDL